MDLSEQIANKYLIHIGVNSLEFEPDGNVPPDFTIEKRIAIEVRRLNQNYELPNGSSKGLEETSIPIVHKFEKLIRSMGISINGECWYVAIDFQRPISWKTLECKIKLELQRFKKSSMRTNCEIVISENFRIDLFKAGKDHGFFFCSGGHSDNYSGGWVMSEIERNLRICIVDKEHKIAPYRHKYQQWWLLLIDYIGFGMDSEDRLQFKLDVLPRINHSFDRIIFVNPLDHAYAFEV